MSHCQRCGSRVTESVHQVECDTLAYVGLGPGGTVTEPRESGRDRVRPWHGDRVTAAPPAGHWHWQVTRRPRLGDGQRPGPARRAAVCHAGSEKQSDRDSPRDPVSDRRAPAVTVTGGHGRRVQGE